MIYDLLSSIHLVSSILDDQPLILVVALVTKVKPAALLVVVHTDFWTIDSVINSVLGLLGRFLQTVLGHSGSMSGLLLETVGGSLGVVEDSFGLASKPLLGGTEFTMMIELLVLWYRPLLNKNFVSMVRFVRDMVQSAVQAGAAVCGRVKKG